jgi:DNA-binding HxlR family transcriptional regulator
MHRTNFSQLACPIARGLERVGEWWSIMILRDAFHGLTRFDQFQKSLGIAPNMLTRRLNGLVESGLLARRRYEERPPRHEYVLTARGQDFLPVMISLMDWSNRHFAPEGVSSQVVDARNQQPVEPLLVDKATLRPLTEDDFKFAAGPAADEGVCKRMAYADRQRAKRGLPA